MLNAHPTGDYVLRLDKLDDAGRKILIDATVSWFIKRKIKICRNTFQSIAQDIASRFKDDKVLQIVHCFQNYFLNFHLFSVDLLLQRSDYLEASRPLVR